MEKFQLAQEREEVLDQQSSRYEERLVELHSVIAELSKQCEAKAKLEDEDEEEAEDEAAGGGPSTPIYADVVEAEDKKADVQSRTSTDVLDAEAVEAGERFIGGTAADLCSFLKLSRSMSR